MQLISSDSVRPILFDSSTRSSATFYRELCYYFSFFRTKKESSLSFMKSYNPSEPINIKSISYVKRMFLISGYEIKPYLRAALSPKALDSASPGPQLFLPGAQIL